MQLHLQRKKIPEILRRITSETELSKAGVARFGSLVQACFLSFFLYL
jgi:hypothetical protein